MIEIIKRLYGLSQKEKPYIKKSIVYGLLYSAFELLQFLAVYIVLRAVVTMSGGNIFMQALITMLLSIAGCTYMHMQSNIDQMHAGLFMAADKRIEIGNQLRQAAMGYFNENSLGKISAVLSSKLYLIENTVPSVLSNVVQGIVYTMILLIGFLCFQWEIGGIMTLIALVYMGIIQLMFHATKNEAPERQKAVTTLTEKVIEYVQGIAVIRSFQDDTSEIGNRIQKVLKESKDREIAHENKTLPYTTTASLLLKFGTVFAGYVAIILYLKGTLQIYEAGLAIIWLFIVFNQLQMAGSMIASIQNINTALNEIDESSDLPRMESGNMPFNLENCSVDFEDVSFKYDKKMVLNHINVHIPSKKTTAIVGYSGSGKTTLCSLIYRFWDVSSGKIKLGGCDIKAYDLDQLLGNISVVFQKVFLFNDTIANNISFGKPNATQAEIEEAAKKACCHDFIMGLPNGYQTIVGENGSALSGGEKQRISIARAIIKDAPIVILDEATSSIDPENEEKVQKAIEELTNNKTVIMIAHRLKTVRNADKIIVMDSGRIVQEGTHTELISKAGIYNSLVNVRTEALGWRL